MKLSELLPHGNAVVTGSLLFTADDIITFARKFDPQPFHTDAEAAKDYVFGALCASGWHTCAGWMKTYVAYIVRETGRLEAAGHEPPKLGPSPGFKKLQWLKPVYAGDTITYSMTLMESRPLISRPGTWINTSENSGVNQKGETVLRFEGSILEFA
jgi:acyl dehydratase